MFTLRTSRPALRRTLFALGATAALGAVQATTLADGAVALSQEAALAGNVTPGDATGFPVTINRSGTYRLTGNLIVPAGLDAIRITNQVEATIDLNGFSIVGAASCSMTVNCAVNNGTAGVRISGAQAHATVINGNLRGFTAHAINGTSATVDNVRVSNNAGGIRVNYLVAQRVAATSNSGFGIDAAYSLISDSRAMQNGSDGMRSAFGVIRDSLSSSNQGAGLQINGNTMTQTNSLPLNAKGPLTPYVEIAVIN